MNLNSPIEKSVRLAVFADLSPLLTSCPSDYSSVNGNHDTGADANFWLELE